MSLTISTITTTTACGVDKTTQEEQETAIEEKTTKNLTSFLNFANFM